MLFRENIAVCSEIHTSTVWAECRIFNVKSWYLQWLLILEGLRREDISNKEGTESFVLNFGTSRK